MSAGRTAPPGTGLRRWLQRLRLYGRLTRIDRPVGTLLLLWPTLTALWFAARGWPGAWRTAPASPPRRCPKARRTVSFSSWCASTRG